MTTKMKTAITPLRQRMIEDMTIRGFGEKTKTDYIRSIKKLAVFLGRSPDTATREDIRRFQFDLRQNGASATTMNSAVSALRFFFRITLGRPEIELWTQFVREARKLPVILSPEEVASLIECAPGPGLKYKAASCFACFQHDQRGLWCRPSCLRSGLASDHRYR